MPTKTAACSVLRIRWTKAENHSRNWLEASQWVLVGDPKKRCEPQAFLSTDLTLSARQIVLYFIRRWSMETTFQTARQYLGVDGQRQWNDAAVARTTPVRLVLYALVALIVQRQPAWQQAFRQSAWYQKARPTPNSS